MSARYLDIEMPERFVLEVHENGDWVDWARCSASDFSRCDDGSYVCSGHGGSPIWIRALSIDADGVIEHVDGDGHGEHHRYRLVPFPSERYQPS